MIKYNFISICFIAIIISCIGSTVSAMEFLVGNICTSEMISKIKDAKTTGVTINVSAKEWAPNSQISVEIDVIKNEFIRNLIIWAETVDGGQPGTHVGSWSPISGHVYVDGCNGPANATISNQLDLNLSQITYEWNGPSETDTIPPSASNGTSPSATSTDSYSTPSPTNKPKRPKCHKHNKRRKHHKHHKHHCNIKTSSDPDSVGSIVFKGVSQLMNHPDEEIYFFESDVIVKSGS